MIHEYFVIAVFWALILIYVSLSRLYGLERRSLDIRAGRVQAPRNQSRGNLKYRIYLLILVILLITYQTASVAAALIMPGTLLRAGISAGYLLQFTIFNIIAVILSVYFILFYRLSRHLKEAEQNSYRITTLNIGRNAALGVLLITGIMYIPGLAQAFNLKSWVFSGIPEPVLAAPAAPLYVLVLVLLCYTGAFVFFILRRSAFSLRQYWIFFTLGYLTMLLYAFLVPGQILDWNASILTRTQLLSWEYGFLGWALVLLVILALFATTGSVLLLRLRDLFNQNGKAKGLSLVYLKTGYICMILAMVLLMFPQLLELF